MLHVIRSHQGRPSDDPIFALNQEALLRREKGESIVNATVGVLLDDHGRLSVLPTAARVVHEVSSSAWAWAPYAPISGDPAFLRAVMDDLLGSEPALRTIALASATPGGSGALRHAIDNFLEPGQALLTTSYYWSPYHTLAEEAGRTIDTFSMFEGPLAASQGLDTSALDRALAGHMKSQGRVLLFLNDPCHNPTGYSMRPEEWRRVVQCLLAHAEEGPVTLLVDCAYLAYDPGDSRAFLRELVPLVGRVGLLFAWSASKTFTHYGLRVGAIVACLEGEAERKTTEAALSYSARGTWSNCSSGGQSAIARLLIESDLRDGCTAERNMLRAMLRARVDAFNGIARAKGLAYPRYDGGFFVTVFHENAVEKAAAMRKAGVFVIPFKGALRVALCAVAERDVPRLVDALVEG
jgi:aromatic-amino-acid transaminase